MDSLRGEKNGKRGEEERADGKVEDRGVTRKEIYREDRKQTKTRVGVKERKQSERREKIRKGKRKGWCRQQQRRVVIKSQKGAEK